MCELSEWLAMATVAILMVPVAGLIVIIAYKVWKDL